MEELLLITTFNTGLTMVQQKAQDPCLPLMPLSHQFPVLHLVPVNKPSTEVKTGHKVSQ
jgi:hypothetical protein